MVKNVISNGFSLLEILITILIACIILGLTIPSFQFLFTRSNADVMREALLHAIQMARSEAILRAETVTLCQSVDQKSCGGHWKDGYIIFSVSGVIYTFLNNTQDGELYWRAFPKNQNQLHFLASGELKAENGTFWYCVSGEKAPRWSIVLNQSGRVRVVMFNQRNNTVSQNLQCYF